MSTGLEEQDQVMVEESVERSAINTDLIGGGLAALFTAVFWLAREEWTFWSAVFPNVILAIIGVLSLLLVVKGFVRPTVRPVFTEGNRVRIVVTALVLVLWAFALDIFGTYLSSLIAFSFLTVYLATATESLRVVDVVKWVGIIALEIGFFYLIFTRALNVPLPRGMFF